MNTKRLLALNIATQAHKEQKRKNSNDYITHPIAVAEIATKLWDVISLKCGDFIWDGESPSKISLKLWHSWSATKHQHYERLHRSGC